MIKQDKLDSQNKVNDDKVLDKEKQENINITNNKDLSINHNIKTSVPTSKREFEETNKWKFKGVIKFMNKNLDEVYITLLKAKEK